MGRKPLLSKPHTLPNCERQPGRRVPSPLVGFLVERGRVAFFYCTLKEQSLEPPLKILVRCQCCRGEGRTLCWRGGVQPCRHVCSPRKGKGTVVPRWGTAGGLRVLRAKAGARCFLAQSPGEVTTARLKIARRRATSSPSPLCLVTRSEFPPRSP